MHLRPDKAVLRFFSPSRDPSDHPGSDALDDFAPEVWRLVIAAKDADGQPSTIVEESAGVCRQLVETEVPGESARASHQADRKKIPSLVVVCVLAKVSWDRGQWHPNRVVGLSTSETWTIAVQRSRARSAVSTRGAAMPLATSSSGSVRSTSEIIGRPSRPPLPTSW